MLIDSKPKKSCIVISVQYFKVLHIKIGLYICVINLIYCFIFCGADRHSPNVYIVERFDNIYRLNIDIRWKHYGMYTLNYYIVYTPTVNDVYTYRM